MKYLDPKFSVGQASTTAGCCEGCVYGGRHADWCTAQLTGREWHEALPRPRKGSRPAARPSDGTAFAGAVFRREQDGHRVTAG